MLKIAEYISQELKVPFTQRGEKIILHNPDGDLQTTVEDLQADVDAWTPEKNEEKLIQKKIVTLNRRAAIDALKADGKIIEAVK